MAFAQGPVIRNVVTTQALASATGFLTNAGGVIGFTRNGIILTNLNGANINPGTIGSNQFDQATWQLATNAPTLDAASIASALGYTPGSNFTYNGQHFSKSGMQLDIKSGSTQTNNLFLSTHLGDAPALDITERQGFDSQSQFSFDWEARRFLASDGTQILSYKTFGNGLVGNGLGLTNLNGANINPGTIGSNQFDQTTWQLATNRTPIPAGNTTELQFNDAGVTAGDAGLVYAKATDTLTSGRLILQAGSAAAPAFRFAISDETGFYDPSGGGGGTIGVALRGTLDWRFGDGSEDGLYAPTDNAVDIGKVSSQRPRTIYAATSMAAPTFAGTTVTVAAGTSNANAVSLSGSAGYGLNFENNSVNLAFGGTNIVLVTNKQALFKGSGTANKPLIGWAEDQDAGGTGLYRSTADSIDFTANGITTLTIQQSTAIINGTIYIGNDTKTSLSTESAGVMQIGDDASTAATTTLHGADGNGTDKGGYTLILGAGRSTGTGAAGVLNLAVSTNNAGSGSGKNSLTNVVSMGSDSTGLQYTNNARTARYLNAVLVGGNTAYTTNNSALATATNSLDMTYAYSDFTATTHMSVTNFNNVVATAENSTVLMVTNGSGGDLTMTLPANIKTMDGARTCVMTNNTLTVFSFSVYGNRFTNVAYRTFY